MAIQNLTDTKIPNIYSTGLYNEKGFDVSHEFTGKMLDILVNGTTLCLSQIKSKDYPNAVVFNDSSDNFIAAAVIEYFEGTDGNPGNWNYSWTFNKEDLPDDVRVITPYEPNINSFFRSVGHTKYGIMFEQSNYAGEMFTYLMLVIKKYLNDNASEAEEWGVKEDGIIQFRVTVENKEKILAAEVDGEIKQLIKDDASIEV